MKKKLLEPVDIAFYVFLILITMTKKR